MDREEALKLLRGGREGIRAWNEYRRQDGDCPNLGDAGLERANLGRAILGRAYLAGSNFAGAYLAGATLAGAYLAGSNFAGANLTGADLGRAYLEGADLKEADLTGADLKEAVLNRAMLARAKFKRAYLAGAALAGAQLKGADLEGADLGRADLEGADLKGANLTGAYLKGADLKEANLDGARLEGAHLGQAKCLSTAISNVDLSQVGGLDNVEHVGPSSIGVDTLSRSKGRIPEVFLRGCGLAPWEVLSSRLYDPQMTPPRFADLQCDIFSAWTKGKDMINGCFISYSRKDWKFVDKLHDRLVAEGINVWLDRHEMVAGAIQDQVWRAIQLHHVVIIVLSEDSTQSDWVENELDMAREKEKTEGRVVLCPVALDEAWRTKVDARGGPGNPSRPLWRTLQQKLILDFSPWETEAFDQVFAKLVRGLRTYYGPKDPPAS